MKRLLCLLPAGLLLIGCAEPAAEQPDTAQGTAAEASDFDYFADADFQSTLADNNVVVVNFTADW